jgi:hypothetical protein
MIKRELYILEVGLESLKSLLDLVERAIIVGSGLMIGRCRDVLR